MVFKYRLIILLLLLSSVSYGQLATRPTPANNGNINTLSTFIGGLQSNIYFRPPRSFNCWAQQDSGGMFWFDSANTKTMWYHNGTSRVQIGAGGGGSYTAGGWLGLSGSVFYLDTASKKATSLTNADNFHFITPLAVLNANNTLYSQLSGMIDSVALLDSTRLADTSLNLRAVFAADLADSMAVARDSVVKRVPYNGANSNLNMGSYGVTAKRANLDTLEPNSSAGLHLHNTSHQDIFIAGAGGGQNLTIYAPTSFSLMANQSETDTVLGSTSTGLVKKIGIATTYLKKADSSLYVTQYRLADTAAAIRSAIPSVAGYATTAALTDSVSGRVTYVDTVALIGTQYQIDTTAFNALTRINTKGNGTVTAIQLVAGTGVSITPTTAVTTSGTYTISATGSTGVQSVTSTGSTAIISGTTTVNVEVDTTHNFTFTGTNTFTRDITIDSATFGTGNGLSTNIKIGRTALSAPTTATGIVAIGENAGRLVTTGQNDIYIGRNAAGNSGTGVSGHVGIGTGNLNYSTGDNNTAIGFNVMARAVAWSGIANVGVGINAGNVMTTATANTFLGSGTAAALTSGGSNTFLGVSSGSAMTTGSNNIILGGYTGNVGGLDIRTSSSRMVLSDGAGNIRAYHTGTNWLIGTVTDGSTGILQLSGNLGLNTAGNKINIATGSQASVGTGTLATGTATINTTAVTGSSIIQVQLTSCSSCGTLYIGTVTAGTSFVVTSTNGSDASTFNYWIIN